MEWVSETTLNSPLRSPRLLCVLCVKTAIRMNPKIRILFSEIASTYDLTNRLMTFGLDVFWRRRAARIAAESGGSLWLDVCCGTGDMIRELSGFAEPGTRIFGADFSKPMLDLALRKPCRGPVRFVLSDARTLPFPDGAFDCVTKASPPETCIRTGNPWSARSVNSAAF